MATSKLAEYEAKRDFAKTEEPSGRAKVPASKRLRFVIQRHAATRLHYDLRLELDGVFKSWAMTKEPSLDPHDKRLAVEVEDHPLEYGDFEGTIPEGQYGGGTVQVWDRGYWEYEGSGSPEEALRKGELKFKLDGQRLKGTWVLVRMRGDKFKGKRNSWLLIKHHDEFAREGDGDTLLGEDRSVASGRSMTEIAGGKGRSPKPFVLSGGSKLRPDAVWDSSRSDAGDLPVDDTAPKGNASSLVKKPKPGKRVCKLPTFIAPQLCTLVERPPSGPGWAHEIKFDGYRIQMRVEEGEVTLRTRKGLNWTEEFLAIANAARRFPDCIIDGEIVALDHNGAPDFAALQAALSDGNTDQLVFFAFDLLFVGDKDLGQKDLGHLDLRELPLAERKARLKAVLASQKKTDPIVRYVEHFETAGDAVLRSACRMALEGIVSKRLHAPYMSGRGAAWTKAKCRAGHEVVIGGWSETNGRFRSVLVGARRGDHLIYLGRVGTGFGQAAVAWIFPKLKALETPRAYLGVPMHRGRNAGCIG